MPADGHGLLPCQPEKAAGDVHRFFPMPVGEGILISKGRHRLPLSVLALDVAGGGPVAAYFAQVVEQGGNGHRFVRILQAVKLADPVPLQIVPQAVVNIDAVVAQSPGIGAMVLGGGGRGEKVAFVLQVVQQSRRALPPDVGFKYLNKLFSGRHAAPPPILPSTARHPAPRGLKQRRHNALFFRCFRLL
ncbi:hypothetical protein SDC9_159250 [bioreactor metagenome]|uniref:Uncharacterized protein n=1 Tax=bioreactor metagenome TaxID=1076179 RepID=A0A645FC93_9ZZZZ